MLKQLLLYIIIFACIQQFHAQEDGVVALDLPVRNGLRFNRYAINPTFSFVREQNRYVSFTNKSQWVQFDDAPQTNLFSYSGRFRENIGAGIGLFQQDYGVLTTFGGIFNFAYNAVLTRDNNLTFGINLGFYQSGINDGRVVTNFPDSSLDNIPKNSVMTINPGINYGSAFFDFGLSVNHLVAYNFKTSKMLENNPEQSVQAHAMYTGYMNTRGFFDQSKFTALMRSEFKKDNTVLSGIVMLAVPKGIWAQAGYNTLYGVSAGIGLNLTKEIALEYNYEQAIGDLSGFGNSHEITIAYKFKKSYRYNYADDDEEEALLMPSKRTRSIAARRQATSNSNRPRVIRQPRTIKENKARGDANPVAISDKENIGKEVQSVKEEQEVQAKIKEQERLEAEKAAQLQAEQEAAKLAEETRQKAEAAAKLKAEQEVQAKLAEETRLKAERERQAKLAEERRLKAEAAAKLKAEQVKLAEEARLKAEEETRLKVEKERQAKLAEEQRLKAEAAAKLKAEQEAQAKLAEEALLKKEAEAKAKADQDLEIEMQELDGVLVPVTKDRPALDMGKLTALSEKSKIEQQGLLSQLQAKVASKQQDLDDLKKENDLSEQGIYTAPKAFKSISAENREIEALKLNIDNLIKSQDVQITELERLYKVRLGTVRNTTDKVNVFYLQKINELKVQQQQAVSVKANLLSELEIIKEATEVERKRRIKRAAYDNEQVRYQKDRATLEQIKQITPISNEPLKPEDFDSGEVLSNIQILKGVNHIENGYYLVVAVHTDIRKRDEFLRKAIAAGQTNIDFFFDVNSSKYYIYYKKFDYIEGANKAIESKGNQPYNTNMSVVKIEN